MFKSFVLLLVLICVGCVVPDETMNQPVDREVCIDLCIDKKLKYSHSTATQTLGGAASSSNAGS